MPNSRSVHAAGTNYLGALGQSPDAAGIRGRMLTRVYRSHDISATFLAVWLSSVSRATAMASEELTSS